jgi:putative nucleotidyltransferase with HDIG domain
MAARRAARLPLEPVAGDLWRRVSYHGYRWGLLVALALLTYLLYPVARTFDTPVLDVGHVSTVDVVAPFAFRVPKSPAEIEREASALAATVRPIFQYRAAGADSTLAEISALFRAVDGATGDSARVVAAQPFDLRLLPEEAHYLAPAERRAALHRALLRMTRDVLLRGVPASGAIESELSREVVVRRDGRERVVPRDSVMSFSRYLSERTRYDPAPNNPLGDRVFVKLIHAVFEPTLVPLAAETERLRADMRASVDSIKDVVQANERIVGKHEVVTPDIRDRLVALRAELLRRGERTAGDVRGTLGQNLANAAILSVFWLLLMLYRRVIYDDLRWMVSLTTVFAIAVVGSFIIWRFISQAPELMPIPFAAMLLTVLISGRVGMVAGMVLAVLLGTQAAYGGQDALYIALLGGVAATLGVRTIRRRSQLLAASGVVAAAFALAALTVGLRNGWGVAQMGVSTLRGLANAIFSGAIVTIALPIFEAATRVTTDLTLLELSDPNQPLLRRLAMEAPGTYAHSIAMANLCEAACNAIGASGLLARVGCYYHDIGKLKRPQFFVENQGHGANPHDKLKPEVSAGIIRSHVKDGLTLAEEHRLPAVVRAFIPEHHGTLEISYFLDRARARGAAVEEDSDVFRYPGPRPHSVETAVAMLGDGVEAALRVLDDPTPQKVRDAIEHLVAQRVQAGQLAEAPLTLAQLDRVKEEFIRVLGSMAHNRIDYPVAAGGITAEWHPASAP